MKSISFSAYCILVLLLVSSLETQAQPIKVGGPCTYAAVPGVFTIVSVEPSAPTGGGAPPPYQPHRVLFIFTPDSAVAEPPRLAGREFPLTLTNGADPGPAYLKRYGLRPGAAFRGNVQTIRTGTCSPLIFRIDGVDFSDLFEGRQP